MGVIQRPATDAGVAAALARLLWPMAVANLVANIGIVLTGGAVRLTSSGLGCPTVPRCTEDSYVPHGELGIHGVIEFGNRTLTGVLAVIALGCLAAAVARRRARRDAQGWAPVVLSGLVLLSIPTQAVIGAVTVLTDLNPWVVSLHLLVSMAIIGVCVLLLDILRGPERPAAPPWRQRMTWLVLAATWLVLYLGTVVTGSGPHSGDLDSRRTGLDLETVSHVHAAAVYLLLGLTFVLWWTAPRVGPSTLRRAAGALLLVELGQGIVGFVQYYTDLPALLVALHLLGAAAVSASATWVVLAGRQRSSATRA